MAAPPTPRLYCIPATAAPIVAVIRRGPSEWAHVGRWDVARGTYEPGAWLHGRLYPERCDLSPDGRWLAYFTLRARTGADWESGDTYIAVSRLPWLRALAAWGTCGTWTRGVHFVDDRRVWELDEPSDGDAGPLRRKFGMKITAPLAFASEHRRGWSETDDSPPRAARGAWDERVDDLTMRKPRPGSARTVDLTARGYYAAFRSTLPNADFDFGYEIRTEDSVVTLPDVQWADWAADGRLLVATTDGRLQVRTGEPSAFEIAWQADLADLEPDPRPPPSEASQW